MHITTILFDLGGTLEDLREDQEQKEKCIRLIHQIISTYDPLCKIEYPRFRTIVSEGFASYKQWSSLSLKEEAGSIIWGDWIFKDFPEMKHLFLLLGDMLTDIWETLLYVRTLRPEVIPMLQILRSRGYRMGIISNTTSKRMPHILLKNYGIAEFFEATILSSELGIRKPDSRIFHHILSLMHLESGSCLYVGDQPSRDAKGPRAAGFAGNCILGKPNLHLQQADEAFVDHWITNLSELPDLMEALQESNHAR